MSLFDSFPYAMGHELNLDWIISALRHLDTEFDNFKVLNTLEFAGMWDITKQYPAWRIVNTADKSYVSLKPVPAGIPLDNTNYWQNIGDLDPRIDNVYQTIAEMRALLNIADGSNMLTVGKKGAQFKTINEAITEARKTCSPYNRIAIIVYPGIYDEEITLLPNPGIDIIGIGKPTIQHNSTYPNAPLFTTGPGFFSGLAFSSTGTGYGCHIESQSDPTPGEITFKDCDFTSQSIAAAGWGLGDGFVINVSGCRFLSIGNPGLYIHNSPVQSTHTQFIRANDCYFYASPAIAIDDATGTTNTNADSTMGVAFANCFSSSNKIFYNNGKKQYSYIPNGEKIIVTQESTHTITGVDFYEKEVSVRQYAWSAANTFIALSVQNENRYNWKLADVLDTSTGQSVLSSSKITSHGNGEIDIQVPEGVHCYHVQLIGAAK